MEIESQWVRFCFVMLVTAVLSYVLRRCGLSMMRKVAVASYPTLATLQPVELAYLLRPGDSAHCLIVLIVDLLQKILKTPSSLKAELAESHYEKYVWEGVSAYIKGWTLQQTQERIPELITRNPLKIAAGFWRLRHWISNSFKSLFADLVKDPLSLRRYFSAGGLMRVFLSLVSSGVKEPLMRSLRNTLLANDLLVRDEVRKQFSRYFSLLACIHLLVIALLLANVSRGKHWETLALFIVCTASNGVILRVLAALPSFLPFYDEVSLVLDSVDRKGFRITILRNILKLLRRFFWSVVGLAATAILALQSLVFSHFVQLVSASWVLDLIGIACLSFNFFIVTELVIKSFAVSNTDQLSSYGQKLQSQYHMQLKSISPLTAFSTVLADLQYNAQLSNIVAIYGVETLLLLV